MWFILIYSWVHPHFFCLFNEPHWFTHHQCFWNIWLSPIETSLWTLVTKCKQMCCPMAHLFSLYTWKLNFGQTIWDKTKVLSVLLRMSWETTWQLGEPNGDMMRTQWEQRTNKKIPFAPPKRRNWTFISVFWTISLATWNFYFQNCLSPFLTWANGKGAICGT